MGLWGDNEVVLWVFAVVIYAEMPSIPWSLFNFSADTLYTAVRRHVDGFLNARLEHMDAVLADRAREKDRFYHTQSLTRASFDKAYSWN